MTTKICTKCNCEKEITEFYFRKDNSTYRNECIVCMKEKNKEYRLLNNNNIKKRKLDYYKKNQDMLLEQKKDFYKKNREDILNKVKKHYIENKEIKSIYNINYRKENKLKLKENSFQYYIKNKNKIIESIKEYRKTEKGKISYKNSKHKRRSLIKDGNININDILQLSTNSCYWCNNKIIDNKYHLDHYIPLSKGGSHTIDNIVVSCPSCNLRKSNKDPFQFALSVGKLL